MMLQALQAVVGLFALLDLLAILGMLWLLTSGGWGGASVVLPSLGLVVSAWLVLVPLVGVGIILVLALVMLFHVAG